MNESELRKHATCSVCRKKLGETGLPIFWIMTAERYGLNLRAVERLTLTMLLGGNAQLASVFSPDENYTVVLRERVSFMICEPCAGEHFYGKIPELLEEKE